MLIIRGVNVFPSQVESALLQIEGTLPHYQIVLTREQGLDQMEVQVEVTPQMFNDKIGALQGLHQKLQARSITFWEFACRLRWSRRIPLSAARARQNESSTGGHMKIQQISLFVENKPGHLTAPVRLLARGGHRHSLALSGGYAAVRHCAHDRLGLAKGCANS